jgi:hypothetical protein
MMVQWDGPDGTGADLPSKKEPNKMSLDNLKTFIADATPATLVSLYNATLPGTAKLIKKFSDRKTAQERLWNLMTTHEGAKNPTEGYRAFYADHCADALKAKIELPEPPAEVTTKSAKAPKEPKAPRVKKEHITLFNVRCPVCGYFAKGSLSGQGEHRLVCPANPKHGILLSPEERKEQRGTKRVA